MDGPAEQQARGRNSFGRGLGYDPAKPAKKESLIINRKVERPQIAHELDYDAHFKFKTSNAPSAFATAQWEQAELFQLVHTYLYDEKDKTSAKGRKRGS